MSAYQQTVVSSAGERRRDRLFPSQYCNLTLYLPTLICPPSINIRRRLATEPLQPPTIIFHELWLPSYTYIVVTPPDFFSKTATSFGVCQLFKTSWVVCHLPWWVKLPWAAGGRNHPGNSLSVDNEMGCANHVVLAAVSQPIPLSKLRHLQQAVRQSVGGGVMYRLYNFPLYYIPQKKILLLLL